MTGSGVLIGADGIRPGIGITTPHIGTISTAGMYTIIGITSTDSIICILIAVIAGAIIRIRDSMTCIVR